MPEARQNSSKLAEMFDRASSFNALVGMAVDVVSLFMALLSSVESAPRAYRLKASNAASPFSTSIGTIPRHRGPSDWVVAVLQIVVASLGPGNDKTCPLQSGNHLSRCYLRKPAHT